MQFFDTTRIRTRFDERLPVADGVELSVDLYLPPEPGKYPVLLNRTAADNNRSGRAGISVAPAERWKILAAQGYIVAAADVRGRGDSGGEFTPFKNEASDGASTIAWLRKLEEANGKIGLFGAGYAAYCVWAAAAADGQVDAIASISPFGAVGEGLLHRGGVVRLDWLFWMHLIGGRTVQAANVPPWPTIYRHLPLKTMDEALGRSDIWWQDWLAHLDSNDPYWKPLDLAGQLNRLDIPGLHITGWWDGQIGAARYYYEATKQSAAPQRLIIGPWDTTAVRRPTPVVGGFDFGPRSLIDLDEELVRYFDEYLKDEPPKGAHTGSRIFITGRNEWQVCKGWPEADIVYEMNLDSSVAANTRRGDGVLTRTAAQGGPDIITHNPEMPVEFQPRFVSFATGANPLGNTLDQAYITARDEVLVYTSSPLEKMVTLSGRARVTLTIRTDASDTDLIVLLSDSFPLGSRDLQLSHTAIRLSTWGHNKPGELLTIELEFDEIVHDFLPGHQIRLAVTPSLFPLYARNLHTDEYIAAREPGIANIELHHGPNHPAKLVLPLALDASQ